jgi:hypothetical protein
MVDAPPYMSLVLPVETGEVETGRIIRESVVRALAAAGKWPVRVEIGPAIGTTTDRRNGGLSSNQAGPYGEVPQQLDQTD